MSEMMYDLSRNTAVQNVVAKEQFRNIVTEAIDIIIERLQQHCGPFGEFAMLVDTRAKLTNPKFTKDGHNIISSINSVNPITAWVFREISHIGKLVEREVGDGTTTAMIMAAVMLREMLNNDRITGLSVSRLKQKYFENFLRVFGILNDRLSISVEQFAEEFDVDEREAVRQIVWQQAMSSTHHDEEISDTIVELFENTPKDARKYLSIRRENYETGTIVKCEASTDQYDIECAPLGSTLGDGVLSLEYSQPICALIVARDTIGFNQELWHVTTRDIQKIRKSGIPVTVLLSGNPDHHTLVEWLKLIDQKTEEITTAHSDPTGNPLVIEQPMAPLGIFTYSPGQHSSIDDLLGLQAVADAELYNNSTVAKPIHNCNIIYKNGTLKINGLYANPDNLPEHPHANDPNHIVSVLIGELSQAIKQLECEEVTPNNIRAINRLRRTYNRIRYTRYYQLVVGGKLHDNMAAIDVVEDAVKACLHTLESGLSVGLNMTTLHTLNNMQGNLDRDSVVVRGLVDAAITAVDTVLKGTVSKVPSWVRVINHRDTSVCVPECAADLDIHSIPDEDSDDPFQLGMISITDDEVTLDTTRNFLSPISGIPATVQPAKLSVAIFERIGEVLLKLLKTNCVVVQGGITPTEED